LEKGGPVLWHRRQGRQIQFFKNLAVNERRMTDDPCGGSDPFGRNVKPLIGVKAAYSPFELPTRHLQHLNKRLVCGHRQGLS
jgi:hypothetical protein